MAPTGLIRNVGTSGNPENIQLIENLAASYISRDNCIILMTITCESKLSCLVSVYVAYPRHQRILPTKAHTRSRAVMISSVIGQSVGHLKSWFTNFYLHMV
jgi:hypothetical protein